MVRRPRTALFLPLARVALLRDHPTDVHPVVRAGRRQGTVRRTRVCGTLEVSANGQKVAGRSQSSLAPMPCSTFPGRRIPRNRARRGDPSAFATYSYLV